MNGHQDLIVSYGNITELILITRRADIYTYKHPRLPTFICDYAMTSGIQVFYFKQVYLTIQHVYNNDNVCWICHNAYVYTFPTYYYTYTNMHIHILICIDLSCDAIVYVLN